RASATLELRTDACVVRRQLGANVLGVETLRARGRANEIAEDDGDDLALLDRPSSRGEGRPAFGAELCVGRILRAAGWTGDHGRSVRRRSAVRIGQRMTKNAIA